MTYNININQEKLLEHQLNITQWMVLSVIANAPTWTDTVVKDKEVYFWTARQLITKELPILKLKNDTVYRVLKKLELLGFIDYEKQGKKDCTRLTKKGKNLFTSTMSDSHNEKDTSTMSDSHNETPMSDSRPTDNYTSLSLYRGGKPTEEQVITKGRKLGYKEKTCISFYLYYESRRWKGIRDFVPLLRKWNMNEKEEAEEDVVLWA